MTSPSPIDPLTHSDIVSNIIPYLKTHPKDTKTLARAARVNKAWHAIYTPALWLHVYLQGDDDYESPETFCGLNFQRQGIHIHRLEIQYLNASYFRLITVPQQQQQEQLQSGASLYPNLKSLCLISYNAPGEELCRFLKSVKSTLRQFSLHAVGIRAKNAEAVITALVTTTDSITTQGNQGGFEELKTLELGFVDHFGDLVCLRWSSLVRLLEAFPRLAMLDLTSIYLGSPVATIYSDEQEEEGEEEEEEEEEEEKEEEEEGEEGLGQRLL
ncbi:hypothetical protein BGZ95_006756, partial [Linnemannia exigua]